MFSVYMYYTYYSSLESQTVSLLSTHVGKMSDSINVRLSTGWLIQESCLVHVHYVVLTLSTYCQSPVVRIIKNRPDTALTYVT